MFTCSQKSMLDAVNAAASFAASSGAVDIYVSATTETSLTLSVPVPKFPGSYIAASVAGAGTLEQRLTIKPQDLVSLKRLLAGSGDVKVRAVMAGSRPQLTLETSGGKTAKIPALADDSEPASTDRLDKATAIDPAVLRDLIAPTITSVLSLSGKTKDALAGERGKQEPHKQSLYLRAEGGTWTAASTDGHRLSVAEVSAPTPFSFTKLVPLPIAEAMLAWAEGTSTSGIVLSVNLRASRSGRGQPTDTCDLMVSAQTKTAVTLSARSDQSELVFPLYRQLIDRHREQTSLRLSTASALGAVKTLAAVYMTGDAHKGLTVSASADRVLVGRPDFVLGQFAESFMVAEIQGSVTAGEAAHVSVSSAYLLDALSFTSSEFDMSLSDDLSPFVLKGQHGSASVLNLVMPLRDGGPPTAPPSFFSETTPRDQNALRQAIDFALAASSPTSTMPALGSLLIRIERSGLHSGTLSASGTDLYQLAVASVGVETSQDRGKQEILVSGQRLRHVLKAFGPRAEIGLSLQPSATGRMALVVSDPKRRIRVGLYASLPVDNWPPVPRRATDSEGLLELPAESFGAIVDSVLPTVGEDDSRPHLTSALFEVSREDLLVVTATNGATAARSQCAADSLIKEGPHPKLEFLFPRDALKIARSMARAAPSGSRVRISLISASRSSESQVASGNVEMRMAGQDEYADGSRVLIVKVVDARFPDLNQVWSKEQPWATGFVQRAPLDKSLRAVTAMESRSEKAAFIQADFSGGKVRLQGRKSRAADSAPFMGHSGQDFRIEQTAKNLAVPIACIDEEFIGLEYHGQDPVVFQGKRGPYVNVKGVLMPHEHRASEKYEPAHETTVAWLAPQATPPVPGPSIAAVPQTIRISDPAGLRALAELEGPRWQAKQSADERTLSDPNGWFSNAAAYKVLADLGDRAAGLTVADLVPSAGLLLGENGRAYALLPSGDVALLGETADKAFINRASAVMLVV